jgi:hypothetical protein
MGYDSWEEQGRLYQQFELCTGSLQELAETENNIPERLIWGYLVDLLQVRQNLILVVCSVVGDFFGSGSGNCNRIRLSVRSVIPVSV